MTEHDDDKAELDAARKAVQTAKLNIVKVDAAAASVHRTSSKIQTIVEKNGYVDRFRQMIRGVA